MTYFSLDKEKDVFVTRIETFPEYLITDTGSQYFYYRDYYNNNHSYYYISPDQPLRRSTSSVDFQKNVLIDTPRGHVIKQLQDYYGSYWIDYESLNSFFGDLCLASIPKAYFGKQIVRGQFKVTEFSSSGEKRYVYDDGWGSLYSNTQFTTSSMHVTCFDGINDYVRCQNFNGFTKITSSFTIVCWMKPNGIISGRSHIALGAGTFNSRSFDTIAFGLFAESGSIGTEANNWPPHAAQWGPEWPTPIQLSYCPAASVPTWPNWDRGWAPNWFTVPPATPDPVAYFGGGNINAIGLSGQQISVGSWYRTIMIFDSSTSQATYYVNTANKGTRDIGETTIGSGPVYIGTFDNIDHFFNGCLYDMRIYSRSWTPAEIATDYAGGIVSSASLVRQWWLDDVISFGPTPTTHEEVDNTYDVINGATLTAIFPWPPPICMHACPNTNIEKVGNIFYNEGIAFITNSLFVSNWPITSSNITYELSFTGSNNIYVQNIFCHMKDHEMNFSNNESAYTTASNGEQIKLYTGSEDKVWISGIGLYDKEYRLVGSAKFASPIRKLPNDKLLAKLRIDVA
jgi:hypothetical protein